jgi:hypothetical protein
MTEVATMEEWNTFLRSDGFYTAPEFLGQKFFLKTGKLPPHGSGIKHFIPAERLGDEEE